MKAEHQDAIERARLHDVPASMFAHGLLVRDLVEAALFELENISAPYKKLNEGQQQEVIERITEKASKAAHNAVAIISSRNVTTMPMTMKEVKFSTKHFTLTSTVDINDPNRHDLIDSAGRLCLLVMAPNDYEEALDSIQPERDQHEFPLHSSNLTGTLFDRQPDTTHKSIHTTDDGVDLLYPEALAFVIESRRASISAIQRALKIAYNRAAVLIDRLEVEGVVSPMDHTGAREVLMEAVPQVSEAASELPNELIDSIANDDEPLGAEFDEVGKEFGDFTYEDIEQLVILHATVVDVAWLQRRTAVNSDQATTILLRLVDNSVIELEDAAEQSIDNTYRVKAKLSDLAVE